jgi:hypothetical protein
MKWIFRLIILGAIGYGGYYLYQRFQPQNQLQPLSIIPADAIFIVESKQPISSWKRLQTAPLWKHLRHHPYFAEVNANAQFLDSLIRSNDLLMSQLGNRRLSISAHQTSASQYDFLFVIDQEELPLAAAKELLMPILRKVNANMTTQTYQGRETIQLHLPSQQKTLHICFFDNLLVLSFTPTIIRKAIDQQKAASLDDDPALLQLRQLVDSNRMYNLYVHFEYLASFMGIYSPNQSDLLAMMRATFNKGGFELETEDAIVALNGYLMLRDSASTYLHALRDMGKERISAYKICSDRTAVYASMQFQDFKQVYVSFMNQLQQQQPAQHQAYRDGIQKIEKTLKISVQDHFLSWIGHEIALLTLVPDEPGLPAQKLVVIHAHDIEDAKTKLGFIGNQVRKRLPFLKFKKRDYKDFEIHQFQARGLFKLLFGKLLAKFDMPYFTYVDNYVVFGVNPAALEAFLDDYQADRVMEEDKDFQAFFDQFDQRSNVFAYANGNLLFGITEELIGPQYANAAQTHQPYIRSFQHMGLQLTANKTYYDTRSRVAYVPFVPEAALAQVQSKSNLARYGEPKIERYPNGKVKVYAYSQDGQLNGPYRSYYRNGSLKEQGEYSMGEPVGTWYRYNRRGKLETKDASEEGEKQPVRDSVVTGTN